MNSGTSCFFEPRQIRAKNRYPDAHMEKKVPAPLSNLILRIRSLTAREEAFPVPAGNYRAVGPFIAAYELRGGEVPMNRRQPVSAGM